MKDILWWCAARGVEWTWSWQAYPGVWLFVAALVVAFFRLERRAVEGPLSHASSPMWRRTAFLVGAGSLWLVLDWPIGAIGAGYLASVHMVQFLVLALIAPPLLLLSIRGQDYRAFARRLPERPFRAVTHPLVTLATFTIILAATHRLHGGRHSRRQRGSYFEKGTHHHEKNGSSESLYQERRSKHSAQPGKQ